MGKRKVEAEARGKRIPLLWHTKPAAEVPHPIAEGTRVLIDLDGLRAVNTDMHNYQAIMAVYGCGSGWRVTHDYRGQGANIIRLTGVCPLGETKDLPMGAELLRIEIG